MKSDEIEAVENRGETIWQDVMMVLEVDWR